MLLGGTAGLAGGWLAYSALAIDHEQPLPPALDAERREFTSSHAGRLSYYVAREGVGRPLVLIHSINAAASAYEMRPLFEHYRGQRPVYALDLPGYGFSNRDDRDYRPDLFVGAIADLLAGEIEGGEAADLVALSLGSEFAARVAAEQPARCHSLTLISPSGFAARGEEDATQRAAADDTGDRLYRLFSFSLWSQAFYDALVSRPSISYFLKQSFTGAPDPGLAAYDYATSHQPGARYAPLAFISGKLFTPDIRQTVYERLTLPVLVLYDQDNFVRFDTLPAVVARHPNWQAARISPTNGLPHFDEPAQTTAALDRFWAGAAAR